MTKKLKSILSILITLTLLFSFVPGSIAATATLTPATTALFGSASFGEGKDAAILTDNDFYIIGNINSSAEASYKGYTIPEGKKPSGGAVVNDHLDHVAAFTDIDSGIEYSWDEGVTVKRLDLWILDAGGIGNFEVQTSEDGTFDDAVVVASGNLDKNDASSVANTDTALASYHPIVFPEAAENVTHLRFVIKSFADGEKPYAYIAETLIYDTNEINLGEYQHPVFKNNSSLHQAHSPYLHNFESSARGASYAAKVTNKYSGSYDGYRWSYSNDKIWDDGNGYFWYTTTFNKSKVKVNKIGLTVAAGTVKEFKVYAALDNSANNLRGSNKNFATPTTLGKTASRWQQEPIATIKCNITPETPVEERTFSIPFAVEANAYQISITDWEAYDADVEGSTGTGVSRFNLYTVADSELSSHAKAAETVFSLLETDTATPDEAEKKIEGIDSTEYTYGGTTYSVEFSENSDFVDEDGNISFHEEEEFVTVTAKITDTNTGIGYTVNKKYTLLPRENECTITTDLAFEQGADESLLADGFVFSSYDNAVAGGIVASEHPEKFAKVASVESAIEYNWLAPNKVNRIDLWVKDAGSVEAYKVQQYKDGAWEDVVTGNLSDIASADGGSAFEGRAVYYPITFAEIETMGLRFVVKSFGEGFSEAYISEAKPEYGNEITFTKAPKTAEGKYIGYSHYMAGYLVPTTSDIDSAYKRNNEAIWPVYEDGTSPEITPSGSEMWYATGFSTLPLNINRVTVNIASGSASEIEVLCADGAESGFDFSNDYPVAPDTLATYKTVATIKGSFNITTPAVIDLSDAPTSKYWMIRVKNPGSSLVLGRVEFSHVYGEEISNLHKAASVFFENRPDNFLTQTQVLLDSTYTYDGKTYNVEWKCSSNLVDLETGVIAEHERDEAATFTAIITDSEDTSVSFIVNKEYLLEGLQRIYVVRKTDGGEVKTPSAMLDDNFTYTAYDRTTYISDPKGAYYHPERFEKLDTVGSGVEYNWVYPKVIKRMELWAWPMEAITAYEIQTSEDGVTWNKHCEGTIKDRFADAPETRPENTDDAMAGAFFYPIVFDTPTAPVNHIRFVVTSFRDDSEGAYIAEAVFKDTNDVNYLAFGTIDADVKLDNRSKYISGAYISYTQAGTGSYNRRSGDFWPQYSSGSNLTLAPRPASATGTAEPFWYATTFQGGNIAINGASISVAAGTAYEYVIMCAETDNSGFKWADYPACPDTLAEWTTVAHVYGPFTKESGVVKVQFDNDFASRHWMIKAVKGSDDLKINGLGLYTYAEGELNSSSFSSVIDSVFDGVSDTSIDNVIKDKMNLPPTLNLGGKDYSVLWTYDTNMINPDGTVIPAIENRKMTLKAMIGTPSEGYMHVRSKEYNIVGQDERNKTTLYSEENVSLSDGASKESAMAIEHGLVFEGKKEYEIDFGATNTGGTLTFMSEEYTVLTLDVEDGNIILNKGTNSECSVPYHEKIKLEFAEETYNIYSSNGVIYETLAFDKALLRANSPDRVIYKVAAGKALSFDSAVLKVVTTEYFDAIEEQFAFANISPDYRATNLNGDITLFASLPDIKFTYTSGNEAVINTTAVPGVGKVNIDSYQETYITVTATSAAINDSFTKTFKVFVGKDNLFGEAVSSGNAAPVDGNIVEYAADGVLETSYISSAKSYKVNIDLKETKPLSKMRIIAADSTANITEITVSVSNDNLQFTDVYTGTSVNNDELIPLTYSESRFVRVSVVADGAGTGFAEILAYSDLTDSEKLALDIKNHIESLNVANGTVIPKEGKFKTAFTLSSSSDVVTFEETADKKGWKVVVGSASREETVTITLNAVNGTANTSKPYEMLVLQDTNIRDNEVPGGGNAGSSGGSGGGGGGGGSSVPSADVALVPDPDTVEISNTPNELAGHWGATEIKNLIMDGIVQGDGKSLSLDRTVTRAEFCKMVVAGLGLELSNYSGIYSDTKSGDWFAPYAQTAKEYGIMSGDSRGFRGNDVISRQEMAVVLINALKARLPEVNSAGELSFTDNDSIASWAKDAVKLASGLELLKGYDTGDFKPEKNLRRDEAMVVVYRLLTHIGK